MSVSITGIGQHSAMGQGLESMLRTLSKEKRPHFAKIEVLTQEGHKTISVYRAPEPKISPTFSDAALRRMSRFTKMGIIASLEAIQSNQELELSQDRSRIGLIVGTAFGCLQTSYAYQKRVLSEGPAGASPGLFANSVHNSMASQISLSLNIQGPNATVTTMEQSVTGSVRMAENWIDEDLADHVLVVVGDEISDYHSYLIAHHHHHHHHHGETFEPTDNACTARLGEGVVAFVLTKNSLAKKSFASLTTKCQAHSHARALSSSMGRQSEWNEIKKMHEGVISTHANHYGSMVTGLAFEILIATWLVHKDGVPTTCLQHTPGLSTEQVHVTV
jgi:3-oxoacyl-(acyl-carrier-protein) synthase